MSKRENFVLFAFWTFFFTKMHTIDLIENLK